MTPEQREELKAAATDLYRIYSTAPRPNYAVELQRFNKAANPYYLLSLIAQVEALTAGMEKIIEMNVQYCIDKYGDEKRAELMGCVRVARDALNGSAPTIPAIPGTKEAES